jgi:DNA-binding transcriptional regulator YiaG
MTPTKFRNLLAKSGLNQQQAAEVLQVTDRTMRRWVSGETPVPKMAVWTILRYTEKRNEGRCL